MKKKNIDHEQDPRLNAIKHQKYINVTGIFLCFITIILLAVVYPSMMSVGDIGDSFSVDTYNNITELKKVVTELEKINKIMHKNQNVVLSFFLFFISLPLCLCFINLCFTRKITRLIAHKE
uniref:hypothetical protein n=1 Tax=Candidatus Electrothrix sp. TaxID=2170559 RepID=UPI004055C317